MRYLRFFSLLCNQVGISVQLLYVEIVLIRVSIGAVMLTEILGYLAGTLTTISFLPQVIKAWKSRSTRDISLGMFLLFTAGVSLWLIYGILMDAYPIIVANFVTVIFASLILVAKFRYG